MGYMQQANDVSQTKMVTSAFYGLDRNKKIAEGYFADMTNMTCDDYPVIRSIRRNERKRPSDNQGYITRKFLIDGVMTDCTFSISRDGKTAQKTYIDKNGNPQNILISYGVYSPFRDYGVDKTIVSFGVHIVVFPDGQIADVTKDPFSASSWDGLNASVSDKVMPRGGQTVIAPCDRNGKPYEVNLGTSEEEPETGLVDGAVWIKTETSTSVSGSTTIKTVMVYSAATASFTAAEPYFIFANPYVEGCGLSVGDAVEISCTDDIVLTDMADPETVSPEALTAQFKSLTGANQIVAIADAYGTKGIVLTGIMDTACTNSDDGWITIARKAPDMDFVCECNNRLWGCKYGMVDGKLINELYCCALGDPYNWRKYQGLSTDSWAASCGSDGPWTGCASYNGYPVFFKQNSITKVYISAAGAHQTVESIAPGVQEGSGFSIATINGILYYKGNKGVYAYDGGFPSLVSRQLGDTQYTGAVSAIVGDKLIIEMTGDEGKQSFSYDTVRGLWCKTGYAGDTTASNIDKWYLTSGIEYFGDSFNAQYSYRYPPSAMYVSRYVFRLVLAEGSSVRLYIEYDSSGEWIEQGEATGSAGMTVALIPVRPHRCDHLRYKLEGNGYAELWTVSRTLEVGAEV